MAWLYWSFLEDLFPPVAILFVDRNVERRFGWWSFRECVSGVCSNANVIVQYRERPERTCTRLIERSCVCVVQRYGTFHTRASIADAARFLRAIALDNVRPNQQEEVSLVGHQLRRAEHILVVVLAELFELAQLPVLPVVLPL